MNSNSFRSLSLHDQNKLLKSILSSLPHVILLLDINRQKNIFVNQSIYENIGYTIEDIHELGDRVLPEIIHPEDLDELPVLLEKFRELKDGESHVHDNRWKSKDGRYIWFRNHVTPFQRDTDGRVVSVLGISKDITMQVNIKQQITAQLEIIERISFSLSHELRHEHVRIMSILTMASMGEEMGLPELKLLATSLHESVKNIDQSIDEISSRLSAALHGIKLMSSGINLQDVPSLMIIE